MSRITMGFLQKRTKKSWKNPDNVGILLAGKDMIIYVIFIFL